MTRPLRVMHRWSFAALALIVPAVLIASWAARRPEPGPSTLPQGAGGGPATVLETVFESEELWPSAAIATRILRDAGEAPRWWADLEWKEPLKQPGLLLYWSATGADVGHSTRLLGAIHGRGSERFRFPADTDPRRGYLVLYSLAHQKVYATAEVPNNER